MLVSTAGTRNIAARDSLISGWLLWPKPCPVLKFCNDFI